MRSQDDSKTSLLSLFKDGVASNWCGEGWVYVSQAVVRDQECRFRYVGFDECTSHSGGEDE